MYALPFPFDVVKGMQLNHKYDLILCRHHSVEVWLAKTLILHMCIMWSKVVVGDAFPAIS